MKRGGVLRLEPGTYCAARAHQLVHANLPFSPPLHAGRSPTGLICSLRNQLEGQVQACKTKQQAFVVSVFSSHPAVDSRPVACNPDHSPTERRSFDRNPAERHTLGGSPAEHRTPGRGRAGRHSPG